MGNRRMVNKIRYIPIEEVSESPGGQVIHYRDHWWTHVPGKGLVFSGFRGDSPQCNSNRFIAETLQRRLYPEAECIQVPDVFVPFVDDEPEAF